MDGAGGAGVDPKKLHPFFSAPNSIPSTTPVPLPSSTRLVTPDPSCSPGSDKASEVAAAVKAADANEPEPAQGRKKRRKTDSTAETREPAKRGRPRGKGKPRVSTDSNIVSHFGQKDDGASCDAIGVNGALGTVPKDAKTKPQQATEQPSLAQVPLSNLNSAQVPIQSTDEQIHQSKPQKLLKFNPRTGTIGSPPRSRVEMIDELITKPRPVGRPKRSKKATCLVVCIQYGVNEATQARIGERIEEIYSGVRYVPARSVTTITSQSNARQISPPISSQETPKKRAPKKGNTPKKAKAPHPFFTGKPKTAPAASVKVEEKPKSPVKRLSIFTSTPCSPRRIRQSAKFNLPQFGVKSGGFKFPGAQLAAWPWQGMVHVHGDERDVKSTYHDDMVWTKYNNRKAKGRQIRFAPQESVMSRVQTELRLVQLAQELKALNTEDFLPTPPMLRVPGRYFESGKRLQTRIQPGLRTLLLGNQTKTHPVIVEGFKSLVEALPAFDRSTCESTAWTQKYGPARACQVLQGGKEAEMLRDWLQTLTVQTVDTGASESNSGNPKPVLTKKKKKRKKLDNFIVSSDDEEILMDEPPEDDSFWLPNGSQGSSKRTVIRNGSAKDGRLTNTVLLSGPPGCGKTATVYAIAKELDFEVFEISPGARRNGRDIIEKIGDMTRNHQVSHRNDVSKPDDAINEDDVAADIQSGKQGMMTAFFRPKADGKPKVIKRQPTQECEKPVVEKPIKKLLNKTQKQSLILLEEVDILYEEDKQFWATVISLMAQSKRPFIMTCNNENLVPIQSLSLHGIFRLSAAPKDLAVDHLLLIAANEGHALGRGAVESLYESRGYDLRASIAELNYWCQIGVADSRGGFGWFYPKWPKGSDLDELGDRIRVVSSDTYQKGMGWLGRDAVSDSSTYSSAEDEYIRQAWENWSLDTHDCGTPTREQEQAEGCSFTQLPRHDRLTLLDAVDSYYDSLSVADITSYGAFSYLNQIPLDPTLASLPNKAKEDFIIGLQLLDASTPSRYDNTTFNISTSIRSLARTQLSAMQPSALLDRGLPDENTAIRKIQTSFTQRSLSEPTVTRSDYSLAFDPIAASEKSLAQSSGYLDPSVFDRTLSMITLDVAPYVRSIVAYDQQLQAERLLRSSLLSEGGKPKKRMRSTRSAYSAIEGGSRASTRREKYFAADLNPHLVMRTGGKDWEKLAYNSHVEAGEQESPPSSSSSSDGIDISMD